MSGYTVTIENSGNDVLVTDEVIRVVSVSEQGPPGIAGVGASFFFTWGNVEDLLIYTIDAGITIHSIYFIVLEAFNGAGATITIGTTDDHSLLLRAGNVDLTTVGTYLISPGYQFDVDSEIRIFNTPGSGATTGSGTLVINF